MNYFTVRIELVHAAMQTPGHVAWALRNIAERLHNGQETGVIHDWNGNKVGEFSGEFEEERDSI